MTQRERRYQQVQSAKCKFRFICFLSPYFLPSFLPFLLSYSLHVHILMSGTYRYLLDIIYLSTKMKMKRKMKTHMKLYTFSSSQIKFKSRVQDPSPRPRPPVCKKQVPRRKSQDPRLSAELCQYTYDSVLRYLIIP